MSNNTNHTDQTVQREHDLLEMVKEKEWLQPFMLHSVDFSLLTLGEWKLFGTLQQQHDTTLNRRARELRFYPDLRFRP